MSDTTYEGIILVEDEPMSIYVCKWIGWIILIIVFIWFLIFVVDANNDISSDVKNSIPDNMSDKAYLAFNV